MNRISSLLWRLIALFLIASTTFSVCAPIRTLAQQVEDPVATYGYLITDYNGARRAYADCANTTVLVYGQLQYQMALANNSGQAQAAVAEAYLKNINMGGNGGFKSSGDPATDLNNMLSGMYLKDAAGNLILDTNGNPQMIPSSQMDLGEMAKNGQLPTQAGLVIQIAATSFTEAAKPAFNNEAFTNAQRVIAEQSNLLMVQMKTCNETIQRYNTDRMQISGEVAAALAAKLNVRELPEELPYFQLPTQSLVMPTPAPFKP